MIVIAGPQNYRNADRFTASSELFPGYDLELENSSEQLRNARKRSIVSDLYLPAVTGPQNETNKRVLESNLLIRKKLERETRFELATCTLARYRSTN